MIPAAAFLTVSWPEVAGLTVFLPLISNYLSDFIKSIS
jgi:hypothetical protein